MLSPRTIALSAGLILLTACFSDPKDDDAGNEDDADDGGSNDGTNGDDSGESGGSDGSTGDDSTDTDGEDNGTGTGEVPTCEDYCEILMDHCQDGFAQYSTMAACLAVCEVLPPGDYGDDLGNSISCRYFHAINAGEDPATSCQHAGPAGAGVCGGGCENFCYLQAELCINDLQQYPNTATCTTECQMFPTGGSFNAADGDDDSFNCRLKHVTYASLDPVTHCPHIVLDSATCQ